MEDQPSLLDQRRARQESSIPNELGSEGTLMKTCTTSISSLKLDSLASQLSFVSISLIKSFGEIISKLGSLPTHSMMRKTSSKINLSMPSISFTLLSVPSLRQLATHRKNLLFPTVPLSGLGLRCALLHYNIFTYPNLERSALSIQSDHERLSRGL